MISRLIRARSGSAVTIFAFSTMIIAVMTAVVMNQVSFYMGKRRLQTAVDMAALIMVQSSKLDAANAAKLIGEQLGVAEGVDAVVVSGRYTADASKAPDARFVANAKPANAIRVEASLPATKTMMTGKLGDDLTLTATALAARRQTTTLAVGSRLVRLEGGVTSALLDATLGYKGKLTVADYNSLASAKVDAVTFLKALNVKADLDAVTFNDVLGANVKVGDVVQVLAASTDSGAAASILAKAAPATGSKAFKLGTIVNLGAIGALPLDALTSGAAFPLNVADVLTGAVSLSDADHQIALNLGAALGDASIADVSLDVGEKPQLMQYSAYAEPGAKLSTSQVKLNIGALGLVPINVLKVDVALASAEIEVDQIKCRADGKADVTVKAVTTAANVGVKALVLPKLNVKLGGAEQRTLSFSPAEIESQTAKSVRSGLSLQVGTLTVAQKLLIAPVDALLGTLGLHTAEADVKVVDADCGSAGLVL
jgi:uncharacterized membrane protein